MSTVIFYSGSESDLHHNTLLEGGAKRVLLSFYYIRDKQWLLRKRKEANPEVEFMIDSGAFTLQDAKKEPDESEYKRFLDQYVQFLYDNKDCLFAAAEFDVESIFGYGTIRKWQQEYFKPLEKAGLPIIYIWHKEKGIGEWEAMCKEHDYVGLNSAFLEDHDPATVMQPARKYLTKVHGFALTRQWALEDLGMATADSITWKSGERFGQIFTFIDGHISRHNADQIEKYQGYIKSCPGIDYNLIKKGDGRELTKLDLLAHLKMEEYLAQQKKIEYWRYRLPPHEVIFKMSSSALASLAETFSHLKDRITLDRYNLRLLSALQRGDWEYVDGLKDQASVLDTVLAFVGLECPISFTDKSRREDFRIIVCAKSLPSGAGNLMRRVDRKDFEMAMPPMKRGEPQRVKRPTYWRS